MLRHKRWRRHRKGLRRRRDFAGYIAFRHRPLFHWKHGNSSVAVKHVEKTGLVALNYDWDSLPVVHDGGEQRRRGRVVVPEIVVNKLEAPNELAGFRAQCDD